METTIEKWFGREYNRDEKQVKYVSLAGRQLIGIRDNPENNNTLLVWFLNGKDKKNPTIIKKGLNIMTNKKEAYAIGYDTGYDIASSNLYDYTNKSNTIILDVDKFISDMLETESDHFRQFSPFEFTAKDFNDSRDPDSIWSAYDEGVYKGILGRVRDFKRAGKLAYDYYTINIPSDCENNPSVRFDLAVMQARENAKLFVLPCDWKLISDDGENVKVCRIRRIK